MRNISQEVYKVKPIAKRVFRMACGAMVLLKIGGPKVFLRQFRRQIYRRDIEVGLVMDMEVGNSPKPIKCGINYHIQTATEEDMNEVMVKAKTESNQSVQFLVHRRWLYDCGFRSWYIARTRFNNALCHMQCVIRPEDNDLVERSFKNWFPQQKEDEVLIDGVYTFETFRGMGLFTAVLNEVCEIIREEGYRRIKTYIEKNNVTSIKGFERVGFTKFEEVKVLVVLSCNRRKFGNVISLNTD